MIPIINKNDFTLPPHVQQAIRQAAASFGVDAVEIDEYTFYPVTGIAEIRRPVSTYEGTYAEGYLFSVDNTGRIFDYRTI
jgi:hypothetical protein